MNNKVISILTSCDNSRLRRNIVAAKNQTVDADVLVFINTLDPEYSRDAVDLCNNLNVCCYITVSNGKPGKGKNEMYQILRTLKGYEYFFFVDGDDFFYPTAVEVLMRYNEEYKSDVLGLQSSDCITNYVMQNVTNHPIKFRGVETGMFWQTWGDNQIDLRKDYHTLPKTENKTQTTTPDRIVFLTYKALHHPWCGYNEDLTVYEDWSICVDLFAANLIFDLVYHQIHTSLVYVYDKIHTGSVTRREIDWTDQKKKLVESVKNTKRYQIVERSKHCRPEFVALNNLDYDFARQRDYLTNILTSFPCPNS